MCIFRQIRALQNEVNAMKDRQRKMRLERDVTKIN